MGIDDAMKGIGRAETAAVFELGKQLGFGNLMRQASRLWQGMPKVQGGGGLACAVGAPVGLCELCTHLGSEAGAADCAWCEGGGWLTNHVAMLQRKAADSKKRAAKRAKARKKAKTRPAQ